jgi:hypothetical protein
MAGNKGVAMETVIDWFRAGKCIQHKKESGAGLAIQTIDEFPGRRFSCPETVPKTSGIYREKI